MTSTTGVPDISIVIVNWNSGAFLERCVHSILETARGCQIIVVDNQSEDGSLAFLDRLGDGIDTIRNRTNIGFASANNIGWKRSTRDVILFLNPDAEALPGSIAELALPLREDAAIWATAGKLVGADGAPQAGFNIRAFPTLGSVFAEAFLLDEILPFNPWTRRYRVSGFDFDSAQDVDQPAAACLMVRRAVLERLGGFDESYSPAWFEDVDFCRRLRTAGGRIRFVPGAPFIHHGGSSLRRLGRKEFLEHFHLNQELYFARHHGMRAAHRVRLLAVAGLRLRAMFSLIYPLVEGYGRNAGARIYWTSARRIASARGRRR
jgi:N-acetylglucosaminyl-diphospho-decaprenol L-rhamnosyltransferase